MIINTRSKDFKDTLEDKSCEESLKDRARERKVICSDYIYIDRKYP